MTPLKPYMPSAFAAQDEVARRIIKDHPFACFITVHDGVPLVTQIPLVFRDTHTLIGHMAKANPHAVALLSEANLINATVQFTGINSYISPAWYVNNTGVPTWNYETVLVQGAVKVLNSAKETESVVKSLIEAFDTQPDLVKQAWADSPAPAQAAQLAAIVAFEIQVASIHAKTKLSQNRSVKDRQGVITALGHGSEQDQRMAVAIQRTLA